MYLTQEQINVQAQPLRRKHLKLEILDDNLTIIDSIEGLATDGSISVNADNDIRRSGNITMAIPISPTNATLLEQLSGFSIEIGGKIWLDKKIKILVGIEDVTKIEKTIVWYSLGVFLINTPTRVFSATEYSISFECIDLMAKLTGKRQGQLTGTATVIEKGYYETEPNSLQPFYKKTEMAEALRSVLIDIAGIKKFTIYTIPDVYKYLPYDIKVSVGATVYDILTEFKNILSNWEMFFDKDGIFIFRPIPSGENYITYALEETQFISDDLITDFENVKNQIVIYGRCNTLSYYTENSIEQPNNVQYNTNDNTLRLHFDVINKDALTISGTTFGFLSNIDTNLEPINTVIIEATNSDAPGQPFSFTAELVKFENSKNSFGKTYDTTQIEKGTIRPNELYFLRIFSAELNNDEYVDITKPITCEFMGKQAVSYTLVNENKESPFYINANLEAPNYYAGEATTDDDIAFGTKYTLTLNDDEVSTLQQGALITFMANATNIYGESNYTKIKIKNKNNVLILDNVPLVQDIWENNNRPYLAENKITNDYTIWLLRYEVIDGRPALVLVGRSPSVITLVCSSGEFDNIYADQLAYERCLYELFLHSNMNDSISITTIPNYLLDVNCKIAYNPNCALPQSVYDTQKFMALVPPAEQNKYEQVLTSYGQILYVKKNKVQYFLTKQINYPLGLDNNAQAISAIKIYENTFIL